MDFLLDPLALPEHLAFAFGEALGLAADVFFGEAFGFGEDFAFGVFAGFVEDSVLATDLRLPDFIALGKPSALGGVSAEPSREASPSLKLARRFLLHLRMTDNLRIERAFRLPFPDFGRPRGSASFLVFLARNWSVRVM